MARLQEINAKHDQLRGLLARHHGDALWLRRTRNLAWITAGADASIPADSEYGVYSILITPEKRVVYTNNIELTRLRAEEQLERLGFEYAEFPWHTRRQPDLPHLLVDEDQVEADLQQLRWILSDNEQARYRALGQDAAAALEETLRDLRLGETEFEIAARLGAACRARGGLATVNLIGTDERISRFRHPLATNKRLEKYAMAVVCMRRGGLVVAATRLGYFGAPPMEIRDKLHKIAAVDAAVIAASQPGRSLGDIFSDLLAAYTAQGETDQWQLHHQGGLIGYVGRERIVTPGDPTLAQAGHAFAWNPSIVGCKSEDTILVSNSSYEIVTAASADWPMVDIDVKGRVIRRPGILEL